MPIDDERDALHCLDECSSLAAKKLGARYPRDKSEIKNSFEMLFLPVVSKIGVDSARIC